VATNGSETAAVDSQRKQEVVSVIADHGCAVSVKRLEMWGFMPQCCGSENGHWNKKVKTPFQARGV
jgi:hypothetical protein